MTLLQRLEPLQRPELSTLQEVEKQARLGAHMVKQGAVVLGIAIYRIFTEKLYLAEVDERGLPLYQTQEDYIPYFIQMVGISRATLFNYYKPVRIITALGMTFDQYERTGGYETWGKAQKYIKYNPRRRFRKIIRI